MTTYRLLLVVLLLSACAGQPDAPSPAAHGHLPDSAQDVRAGLYAQLNEWRGTPYQYGGYSKRGVDCSGFVSRTFQDRFSIELPRTTAQQSALGQRINSRELSAGDLLFFKTGLKTRHVGIYVADGNFIHASTSAGVTLSNINSRYWARHFWQARRIR